MIRAALLFASVALLTTVVAVYCPAPVAAQGLGPGSEVVVSALVIAGGPLGDGVQIVSVHVEARTIEVSLRDAAGAPQRVTMVPRGAGGASTIASTGSFDFIGEEESRGVAAVLAARVRARDDGNFWSSGAVAETAAHDNATQLGWADDARRWLGWLGLAALLGAGALHLARRAFRSARKRRLIAPTLGAAAVVFVVALCLRTFVTPWAPLHSNDHGIATVRGLVTPGALGPDESTRYGVAYAGLIRPIAALCGGAPQTPFAVAAFAGALTAVLVLLLTLALSRSLAAGIVAGAGFALHPMHVRVSGSESSLVLAAALAIFALVGVVYALDLPRPLRARRAAIRLAALSTGASLELGWNTPAFGIGIACFAIALRRPRVLDGLHAHVAAGVAWVALAAALHALSLAGLDSGASGWAFAHGEVPLSGVLSGERSGLRDPTMASLALVPLATLGAVAWLWSRRFRAVAALLLFGAVVLVAAALVAAARRDVIRYAAGAHVVHFVFAAGLVVLARRRKTRAIIAALLLALLLGTSLPGLADVAHPDATATQWTIARAAPHGLASVVVAPYRLGRKVLSDYPEYLVRPAPRVVVAPTRDATTCRVWIGMPCWSFAREELAARDGAAVDVGAGPMRRECVELLGGRGATRRALGALTPVPVRHRSRELNAIPAPVPRVGYAPCIAR